jgi:hypothetical protein
VFPEVIEQVSPARPGDMQALRTEPATIWSDATRLGLVLALPVITFLSYETLLFPDGLAPREHLGPAGVLCVPLDALGLDATPPRALVEDKEHT